MKKKYYTQSQHFIETGDAMQSPDSHFVNLVIEHVDQKIQTPLPDIFNLLSKATHAFNPCQSHIHRVIFQQKQ